MKRFLPIIYILIMCIISANAQSTQKVRVVEYNGEQPKTPLCNVEIAVGNASTVVSDEQGQCTLQFRTLTQGDKIFMRRVTCPGYVVFNKEILDELYVNENQEIVIVMCKQKVIMDLREHYKQAVTSFLQKQYNGRENSMEYAEKLEEMEDFIDKFVYIDLEYINPIEKNALDMIAEGNVLGAINIYSTENLMEIYRKEKESLDELTNAAKEMKKKKAETEAQRDKAYESVKRYVALLRFQGGEDNIEHSFNLLHDVAYADTTNYPVLLDYAGYCTKCDKFSSAEAALRFCMNAPDSIVRIQSYIVKSIINARRHHNRESLEMLERSSEYLRNKSREKNAPTLYLAERVKVIQCLVSSYNSLRDSAGASKYRMELLDLSHRYFELKNDSESKRTLVEALYYANYSHAFIDRDYSAQLGGYNEAIRLQEELQEEDPTTQTAMLAFLYNARAITYSNLDNDNTRVIKDRERAVKLYEDICPKNPRAYIGYLGSGYRNLAETYESPASLDLDKAFSLLHKAEYYINEELRINPETSRSRIAAINYSYAVFFDLKDEHVNCEFYALKAIEDYKHLYKINERLYKSPLKRMYMLAIKSLNTKPKENAKKIASYKEQCKDLGIDL